MSIRGFKQFNSESSSDDSESDSQINDIEINSQIKSIKIKEPVLSLSTLNKSTMAVLKQEYLNMIPEFSGESELLPRFIEICEKLVVKFYNTQDVDDFQNEYLMSSILAKVKGAAAINISSCVIKTWDDLKTALLNAYSDKRDLYTLNIEMVELKQNNESPFDFYNRIQHILNLQMSYLTTHIKAVEVPVISGYLRNLALRVLLRGLKEPLGSLMRTKNPLDLNSALNMLTNDFQLESVKQKLPPNKFIHIKNKPNHFKAKPNYLQLTNFPHNNNFSYQNNGNFNNPANRFQPNANNNFNANRNNYRGNSNQNNFRSSLNQNNTKPTPMSVSTANTWRSRPQGRPNQNLNNQPHFSQSRPNFVSEELFNIEETPRVDFPEESQVNQCNDQSLYDDNNFLENVASEKIKSLNLN